MAPLGAVSGNNIIIITYYNWFWPINKALQVMRNTNSVYKTSNCYTFNCKIFIQIYTKYKDNY